MHVQYKYGDGLFTHRSSCRAINQTVQQMREVRARILVQGAVESDQDSLAALVPSGV